MACFKVGVLSIVICFVLSFSVEAQREKINKSNLVYVDKKGVLRYTKTKGEASFFGVNYTVPFAYGYRSVQRTGITVEQAIDDDVYHLARLGLDAFRVHVWDWEITDSLGNLLQNEHLRLFDYLIAKLKERKIKILITPIAFWGNGYPEKDEPTKSFSNVYGKGPAVVNEAAIKAQERYLGQFFNHVNQYTKLSYKDDRDVIATELNNEPHHSGPKEKTTEYINRLAAAVRATGWDKPVFYNISESPAYADAVAKANVQGHSFQWYPTGLVANRTLQGNMLPNVDNYYIPFIDTIPAFKNKARMVYEFDAGDVLQSNMYPAIVRSFRGAGFQWATQFAYDPMATAYANTEYQTHYLNLAYTPSKAISLLIAGKAFRNIPLYKKYGTYPADSSFDAFRVSYNNQLSEMNSSEEYYYSNSTTTSPKSTVTLQHIAGVGSSPIVTYNGYGAYFIDKLAEGVWRLEVMPDAIHIRDPFERASPNKEVTRIQWQQQHMKIMLPDLGPDFIMTALNAGNNFSATPADYTFNITPGTYLLKSKSKAGFTANQNTRIGIIGMNEFVAPKGTHTDVFVTHTPAEEVSSAVPFLIKAKVVGVNNNEKISLELRQSTGKWKTLQMRASSAYDYYSEVPVDMVTPGVINYRIIIQKDTSFVVFPGNHKGNPYAWDAYDNESWETFVAAPNSAVTIFNANDDRSQLDIYNSSWRSNTISYVTSDRPRQLIQKLTMNAPLKEQGFGWQLFIGDKLSERKSELSSVKEMVVNASTTSTEQIKIKISFISTDGVAYSTTVLVSKSEAGVHVPITAFKQDSTLLLPRPYPAFQPLMFASARAKPFSIADIEKLQFMVLPGQTGKVATNVELESILLR